jgi:DNA-binding XRE family transcriptional regulator
MGNELVIGNRIAEHRQKRGITQQQLADAIKIGRPALSNIENGKFQPSAKTMRVISDTLQTPLGEIFFNPSV